MFREILNDMCVKLTVTSMETIDRFSHANQIYLCICKTLTLKMEENHSKTFPWTINLGSLFML
jgi:predicted secreted protein